MGEGSPVLWPDLIGTLALPATPLLPGRQVHAASCQAPARAGRQAPKQQTPRPGTLSITWVIYPALLGPELNYCLVFCMKIIALGWGWGGRAQAVPGWGRGGSGHSQRWEGARPLAGGQTRKLSQRSSNTAGSFLWGDSCPGPHLWPLAAPLWSLYGITVPAARPPPFLCYEQHSHSRHLPGSWHNQTPTLLEVTGEAACPIG